MVEHKVPGLVSITGSVRAGIAVASGAAKGLKRAHLELGGKAPAIVFKDADIKKSAAAIAEFAFFNAGQDCTAITRVLVEDSVHDDVVAAMVEHTKTLHTGSQNDEDNYFGPLNNVNHFNAVTSVVGAPAGKLQDRHRRPPRRATRASSSNPPSSPAPSRRDDIVQKETFGPVITVQKFTTEDGGTSSWRTTSSTPWRPASGRSDHGTAMRLSRDLDFGAVWINTHILLTAEMPHGGFKQSGYGKDLSMYGVEDYTRIKHVMSCTRRLSLAWRFA